MNDLDKYIIARWCYSVGKPIISDAEYNQLHRTMCALHPDNPYVNRSWSSDPCPKDLLIANGMKSYIYDVVLTDKTESIPSLNTFLELENVLGKITYGTISYKHDGWNYQASYYDGRAILFQSRGRERDAVSAEHMLQYVPQEIPKKGKVTVVMEVTVSNSVFEFCKRKFGNVSQRGAVSTLIANKEYSHLLSMHAFNIVSDEPVDNVFETLQNWGYKTPMWKYVYSYQDILEAIDSYSEYLPKYDSPTDGLVFKGELTRAIRLKAWAEPIMYSYVLTEEECKKMGIEGPYTEKHAAHRISVNTSIYPITMRNSTQRTIPMTNLQRIIDYNLHPGAPIAFRIASSAIADMDEAATKLIQKEYYGREIEYHQKIQREEALKKVRGGY